jgi:hypothetical protein
MNAPPGVPPLRSLRIGEIFDRATTFYARNFLNFSLIVLTLLLPLNIVSVLIFGAASESLADALQRIQKHEAAPPISGSTMALTVLFVLLSFVLGAFVNNAVAAGVAALYEGRPVRYADAFKRVLARAWPLLGTIGLATLMLIGAYIALVISIVMVGILLGVGLAAAGLKSAVVVVVFLLLIVGIFGLLMVVVANVFAFYGTTLEGQGPGTAIARAFVRLFNRAEIGKAALMTLAYLTCTFVAAIVANLLASGVTAAFHAPLAGVSITIVSGAVLNAYTTVLLAVYYFDVRTRSEGLDLELEIARLSPSA